MAGDDLLLPVRSTTAKRGPTVAIDLTSGGDESDSGASRIDRRRGRAVSSKPAKDGPPGELPREDPNSDGWETDSSLYEDAIEDTYSSRGFYLGPEVCTPAEARAYLELLHNVGADKFIYQTLSLGRVSAKKLCTAFGFPPPAWLNGQPDEAYYRLIGHAIARELSGRKRLPQFKTIDDAATLLQQSNSIMVITGAGISTSLGIPDFRSKHTGFYSKLQDMGFEDPQDVFDIHHFDEDPTTFYSLAGDILPDLRRWSPTHEFINVIQQKGKLLTNYTQNIDNLESRAGILPEKLIQCHGSFATATCRKCRYQVPGETIFDDIRAQRVSRCARCTESLQAPRPRRLKRKRSSNGSGKGKRSRYNSGDDADDDDYNIPEAGVMKPDITFFGEGLPETFFNRITTYDKDKVDLVIVIGTSMKVAPVSEIPHYLPNGVPQIYISRDPIKHIKFDINLLGDCDTIVTEICRRAGWNLDHEMVPREDNTEVVVSPCQGEDCIFTIRRQVKGG
ncbi:DHS-like NAD/FAD-binding domain-containing protein [Lineolata rhizophorae]|uniref:DHS-like NAD/FAD-binding domain-containing protein n=1 Tax=Lineolata rhizophorae TaxID=578093 RepID=A0A6A6PCA8_9PEZI|nr:DHS-like NAD/FAD-binding domain-containing protein [Lineolata rhizophorae]